MSTISEVSTKKLVEELEKREGVEAQWIEPYIDKTITVSGPALVLTIID